jgi:hypothetical protein
MSCCRGTRPMTAPAMPSRHIPSIVYRYEGTTALTVVGRATNRSYHFAAPGAELAVDWRDHASVAQVPKLREIRRG